MMVAGNILPHVFLGVPENSRVTQYYQLGTFLRFPKCYSAVQ